MPREDIPTTEGVKAFLFSELRMITKFFPRKEFPIAAGGWQNSFPGMNFHLPRANENPSPSKTQNSYPPPQKKGGRVSQQGPFPSFCVSFPNNKGEITVRSDK